MNGDGKWGTDPIPRAVTARLAGVMPPMLARLRLAAARLFEGTLEGQGGELGAAEHLLSPPTTDPADGSE